MTSRFHARLIGCLQQIKGSGRPQPAVCCRLLAPGSFDASGEADPSKGATFQAAGAERCIPENPSTSTLLLCPRSHPPHVDGKARVPKFRKAVWRGCLQAHWDEEHRGVAMPDATTTAIRLAPDELEWCNILARGGKVKTAKRKREAAVAQAEAEEATHDERRVAEGAQRRWPMRGIAPGRVREAAQQPADRAAWAGKRDSSSSTAAAARGVGEKQPLKNDSLSSGEGPRTPPPPPENQDRDPKNNQPTRHPCRYLGRRTPPWLGPV